MIQQGLYDILIRAYRLGIGIASLFNPKAKKWIAGRRTWKIELSNSLAEKTGPRVWFHAASLGEFEQGRPIIELLRKQHPELCIVLSFFSPSGYEVRKEYQDADFVTYLPLDTRKNAKDFLQLVRPDIAVFIKYEFWFNLLGQLRKDSIPAILVSGRMHTGQGFFKPWGDFFKKGLTSFDHFFLQDEESAELLSQIGFNSFTVNGDTRFDRVYDIKSEEKSLPEVKEFCGEDPVIVVGSSWPFEEILLQEFIGRNTNRAFKLILAPHEIDHSRIDSFIRSCPLESVTYSQIGNRTGMERVLVIDNIGMLSHLYQFASIALIGGGFGNGIHNVLEAAVWGCPVVFGPRYKAFHEAVGLVEAGGGFPVEGQADLDEVLVKFLNDSRARAASGSGAARFCAERKGASDVVLSYIRKTLNL